MSIRQSALVKPTVRERALSAAMTLVSRHGPFKTTMGDIAREARCSRAALYTHFLTKDTLLAELWRAEAQRFLTEMREQFGSATPNARTMEDAFVYAMRFWRTHPATHAALSDPALLSGGFGGVELGQARVDVVAAIFQGLIGAGVVRQVDPRVAAEAVLRLALTYILAPADGGGPGEEEAIRTAFREVILRGLLPRSAD